MRILEAQIADQTSEYVTRTWTGVILFVLCQQVILRYMRITRVADISARRREVFNLSASCTPTAGLYSRDLAINIADHGPDLASTKIGW